MQANTSAATPAGIDGGWEREAFGRYREWLQAHWEVRLDLRGARQYERFDPRVRWTDPFRTMGLHEARNRSKGVGSDHITWFMARTLQREAPRLRGREVWEVGCGSGLLSAICATAGARVVRAADIWPTALECARRTAALNGVEVDVAETDLFYGCPWITRPEVILADLPQKPVVGTRYPLNEDGGPQGISLLLPFIEEAARRLGSSGTLYFFLHSLPHPEAMLRLHRQYRARVVSWMWQLFNRQTLREIHRYLVSRRRRRLCYFVDLPDGRFAFPCMIFSATPIA